MIKIGFFGAKFDTENLKRGILFIGSPGSYDSNEPPNCGTSYDNIYHTASMQVAPNK